MWIARAVLRLRGSVAADGTRGSAHRKGRAAVIGHQASDQLRRLLSVECQERQGIELDTTAEISVRSVSMGRDGPHVWDECDIIRWAGPGLPRAFTSYPPLSPLFPLSRYVRWTGRYPLFCHWASVGAGVA